MFIVSLAKGEWVGYVIYSTSGLLIKSRTRAVVVKREGERDRVRERELVGLSVRVTGQTIFF